MFDRSCAYQHHSGRWRIYNYVKYLKWNVLREYLTVYPLAIFAKRFILDV